MLVLIKSSLQSCSTGKDKHWTGITQFCDLLHTLLVLWLYQNKDKYIVHYPIDCWENHLG